MLARSEIGFVLDGHSAESISLIPYIAERGIEYKITHSGTHSILEWAKTKKVIILTLPTGRSNAKDALTKSSIHTILLFHTTLYNKNDAPRAYLLSSIIGKGLSLLDMIDNGIDIRTIRNADIFRVNTVIESSGQAKIGNIIVPNDILYIAASAHNLWAAYNNEYIGVTKEGLAEWRKKKLGIDISYDSMNDIDKLIIDRYRSGVSKLFTSEVIFAVPTREHATCSFHGGNDCGGLTEHCFYSSPSIREYAAYNNISIICRPSHFQLKLYSNSVTLLRQVFNSAEKLPKLIWGKSNSARMVVRKIDTKRSMAGAIYTYNKRHAVKKAKVYVRDDN